MARVALRDLLHWLCGAFPLTSRYAAVDKNASQGSDWLGRSGLTGALIRSREWEESLLGPPEGWPPELEPLVGTMLASN